VPCPNIVDVSGRRWGGSWPAVLDLKGNTDRARTAKGREGTSWRDRAQGFGRKIARHTPASHETSGPAFRGSNPSKVNDLTSSFAGLSYEGLACEPDPDDVQVPIALGRRRSFPPKTPRSIGNSPSPWPELSSRPMQSNGTISRMSSITAGRSASFGSTRRGLS
jgi:hypothetical protein